MSDSCFVRRLDHYLPLTRLEREAVAALEDSPKAYPGGTTIISEGDDTGTLYTVSEGWLFSSNMLLDGKRQILSLHYPGDVLGTASIAFTEAAATVVTGCAVEMCRFSERSLGQVFATHPRLAALFYSIGMLENVALADRLKTLGSASGKGRLAGFLLEMQARLRTLQGEELTSLDLQLTQADIGDCVGLTKIHINRLFRQLEVEDQAIRRSGRHIEILREDYLIELSSFEDRYKSVDTSWFPPPVDD